MARARPPASGKPYNTRSSLAPFAVRRVLRAASSPPLVQTTARLRPPACKSPRPEPSPSCSGRRGETRAHPRALRGLAAADSTRIGRGVGAYRLGSLHRIRRRRVRVLNHRVPGGSRMDRKSAGKGKREDLGGAGLFKKKRKKGP